MKVDEAELERWAPTTRNAGVQPAAAGQDDAALGREIARRVEAKAEAPAKRWRFTVERDEQGRISSVVAEGE